MGKEAQAFLRGMKAAIAALESNPDAQYSPVATFHAAMHDPQTNGNGGTIWTAFCLGYALVFEQVREIEQQYE